VKLKSNFGFHAFPYFTPKIMKYSLLFYAFFALLGLILEHKLLEIVPFLVSASYTFFVYDGVFKEGSRGLNILRSAATYALFLIFVAAGFIFVFLLSKI